jgi:outer membrane receptor protein involved in Fe transport
MTHFSRLKTSVLATASAAALAAGLAPASALAQETPAAESADRVIVTGSRIARVTDYTTTTPTTVLGAEELSNLGIVNAGEALQQIPTNVSTFSPTATGNSNFFAGSVIPNLRGLNPFFGSRTLTLVDTRRHVPTNQGDGVDLNFIPSIMIDRVETVTGGASAAYGSGAIAGVTNILLDRDFVGTRVEADYGVSEHGDGDDLHIAFKQGLEFLDGRANFVIGGEFQDSELVGCQDARDWCADNIGFLENGAAFGTGPVPYANARIPGFPQNIRMGDLRANQVSTTGVFLGTGIEANAAGTGTDPFTIGGPPAFANPGLGRDPATTVTGGDGLPVYQYTNLRSPVERYVGTALFSYDLTDDMELSLEASYGSVETLNPGQGSVLSGAGFTRGQIAEDNYYVQQNPALAAALQQSLGVAPPTLGPATYSPFAPAGVDYARFGKDFTDSVGGGDTLFDTEVWRVAGSLAGDLNVGPLQDWAWNVSATHGETERTQFVNRLRSNYRYLLATDVVADANGNPVCRVTRDGVAGGLHPEVAAGFTSVIPELAMGCVPLNPFGSGPLDPDAQAYAFGALREDLKVKQSVVAANLDGEVFEGFGAGPFQLAVGAEYRHETGDNVAGRNLPSPGNTVGGAALTDAERADFGIQYGESFSGVVDVYEAYAELNAPLLADRPGFSLLEVNGAVRQSRYENESTTATSLGATSEHDITAWKLSGIWDPVEWFRLRGTVSRDIRAPNFRELYYRQVIPAGGLFGSIINPTLPNPFPGSQTDLSVLDLQGNIDAKPEEATTWTAGFVFDGRGFLDGFQFAADYYNIEIDDRLTPASTQRTLTGCFTSNLPEFCGLIFDAAGLPLTDPAASRSDVSRVVAQTFNAGAYETTGVDISASYLMSLGDEGSLSFRLLASRVIDQFFDDGAGNAFDYSGATGGGGFLQDFQSAPDWQGNFTTTFAQGPLTLTGQVRYVGEAKINYEGLDPSDEGYDPNLTDTYAENSIDDYFLFNSTVSYAFEDVGIQGNSVELWASVNNIFDTTPPLFGGGGFTGGAGGTNPIFYDVLGRYFRFGVRTEF